MQKILKKLTLCKKIVVLLQRENDAHPWFS